MSSGRLAFIRGDLVSRLVLAVVQAAAIAWFSPGPGLPLDDAWIHQVVARTFADTGTLGYAPGQHGAAATSYLWAALLAIDFKIRLLEPTRWALVLNGLAALATGQLLHSIILRARPEGVTPRQWTRDVVRHDAARVDRSEHPVVRLLGDGGDAVPCAVARGDLGGDR